MATETAWDHDSDTLALSRPAPWHSELWQGFTERMDRNQLPATLLLHGVEGIGKRLFLTALSERLLCHQPTDQGACGQCKCCRLLMSGHHLDALTLDDTAIKVDQVRHLIDFTLSTPQQEGPKVVILGPLESLNANSANALLKCLEEPPSYVHFLLFSHVVQQVMPTIRSRCMAFEAPSPSLAEATSWLVTQSEVPNDERLQDALQLSAGTPMGALQWLDSKRMAQLQALTEPMNRVASGEGLPKDAFKGLSLDDLPWVLDWLINLLQRAIKTQASQWQKTRSMPAMLPSHTQALSHCFTGMGVRRLFAILEQTQGLKGQVLQGGNPNVALVLEQWTLQHVAGLRS